MTPSRIPLEAVVFDFDGTLAELVLDFTAMKNVVAASAAAYLRTVPPPDGLPALEYAERLAGRIRRASPDDAGRFLADAAQGIRDMETEAAKSARLFPQTRAALASLARRGIGVGIITRNCRAAVDVVFPDARQFAGVILARDDARHVKPDPRHLLDALHVLGAAPERSLMAGDHPMDLATGKAAGSLTAGVASGRVTLEELARHGPDYLAADVAELVAML
uniref:phosphoglycolate phosphatase n=1 Tax=Desulfovibrio sp. U5L TaxID=596152 RepID=I2Q7B5_9BACT